MDFDVDAAGLPINAELVFPPFTFISLVDGLAYIISTEEALNKQENAPDRGDTNVYSLDIALALSDPIWELL